MTVPLRRMPGTEEELSYFCRRPSGVENNLQKDLLWRMVPIWQIRPRKKRRRNVILKGSLAQPVPSPPDPWSRVPKRPPLPSSGGTEGTEAADTGRGPPRPGSRASVLPHSRIVLPLPLSPCSCLHLPSPSSAPATSSPPSVSPFLSPGSRPPPRPPTPAPWGDRGCVEPPPIRLLCAPFACDLGYISELSYLLPHPP